MGKDTIILMFENPRRSRQARNFTENDPKILDLKSSSEQIIFRKLSLGAPDRIVNGSELRTIRHAIVSDNSNFSPFSLVMVTWNEMIN